MQVCGVDDAGRGSMLGPLVIAGVSIRRSKVRELTKMGVRDSKKLTPARRSELFRKIIDAVDDYHISRIGPATIDRSVRRHLLNRLEARYMAKAVAKLGAGVSYVDSCDVNPARFGRLISEMSGRRVRSYHHADDRFAIVSAASIIAKVSRDKAIARITRRHDGIGSGYPSDRRTVDFVRQYIGKNMEAPRFARASWSPVIKMISEADAASRRRR